MLEKQAGLTWSSQWIGPMEGPFTLMAKLRSANRIPANALGQLIFGKGSATASASQSHRRSFLTNHWILSAVPDWDGDFRQKVASGSLDNVVGGWAKSLASDTHLRYCPTCLSLGYQSALCQIDALERCPVHGDALTTECGACGAPTPRYAFEATRGHPMHCTGCLGFLAAGWNDDDVGRWRPPPAAAAYVELASALMPFKSARWVEREAWDGAMQIDDPAEVRILQFEVLRQIAAPHVNAPCLAVRVHMRAPICLTAKGWGRAAAGQEFADPPQSDGELMRQSVHPRQYCPDGSSKMVTSVVGAKDSTLSATTHTEGTVRVLADAPICLGPRAPAFVNRRAVYDAVCKNLLEKIGRAALQRKIRGGWIDIEFAERYLEPECDLEPEYLAYALFRRRFERHESMWHLDDLSAPAWAPNLIAWPQEYQIEGEPWRQFLLACYQANLDFATYWCSRVKGMPRCDGDWHYAMREYLQRVRPRHSPVPAGMGVLALQTRGSTTPHMYLAFAVFPDLARE